MKKTIDELMFPEEKEEANSLIDMYNDIKSDKNNISYWFPKIKDCGISVPNTFIKQVPIEIFKSFFMNDFNNDKKKIQKWIADELIKDIPKELHGVSFVKNGCFSNKFDFNSCVVAINEFSLLESITNINYQSLCYDTGGNTEIAIRELIRTDKRIIPTIYNGMPLLNEFRVFYDFDKNSPLYIVNYWDYDYCHSGISSNATDKIVYEHEYQRIEKGYEKDKDFVLKMVSDKMKNVSLDGKWSIDIMKDITGKYWLIDMAVANRSAYWRG